MLVAFADCPNHGRHRRYFPLRWESPAEDDRKHADGRRYGYADDACDGDVDTGSNESNDRRAAGRCGNRVEGSDLH